MDLLCQGKECLDQLVFVADTYIVLYQGNIRRYVFDAHREWLLIVARVTGVKPARGAWVSWSKHAHRMHYN